LPAGSGFFLLRAQKNRSKYRASGGFSQLPAAGQNDLLKIAFFGGLPGVVGGISALSLEIRIFSWKFKRIAGNLRKSLNFSARA
jgi:hypothetical protein